LVNSLQQLRQRPITVPPQLADFVAQQSRKQKVSLDQYLAKIVSTYAEDPTQAIPSAIELELDEHGQVNMLLILPKSVDDRLTEMASVQDSSPTAVLYCAIMLAYSAFKKSL
jgi:hypothetical protein